VIGDGQLELRLKGSAGQSLGAFSVKGLKIVVDGDANDYVGKGLSGATIVVRGGEGGAIIGNTCLYGATSGALFAAGRAGGRFAVRNSGAIAVVEGCLSNGCEYMTGGVVVMLGPVGFNFGAGMTGGEAFVHDPGNIFDHFANSDTILIGDAEEEAAARLRALLDRHAKETGSAAAQSILADWARARLQFRHVIAKEAAAQAAEQERLRRVEEAARRPAFAQA
jgi:glutamate synthase (NADPH/NADH) large chain